MDQQKDRWEDRMVVRRRFPGIVSWRPGLTGAVDKAWLLYLCMFFNLSTARIKFLETSNGFSVVIMKLAAKQASSSRA